MLLHVYIAAIAFLFTVVRANTEKIIFTAPESINFGDARPGLEDLHLDTLSLSNLSLRTALPAAFPTNKQPQGLQSWYLLQHLVQGQRYEVRVCWPATQPTQFWIEAYNVTHVFNTPSLIQDLAEFAENRQADLISQVAQHPAPGVVAASQSALLLRVWAAADYFTTDQTLMQHPLPVDINIILDPYLLNIVPQSLLPTAAYIIVLAVVGWYISKFAIRNLERLLVDKEHTD